jgi:3-keto-5-aminohexanoate cleavage enzyme
MSLNPIVINAALTGMVPNKRDNPALPTTAAEIADDVERSVAAGASVVHLHARDDEGKPTWRPDTYRRIVAAVRDRVPEVVVCVSTSGRVFGELEQRAAVLDLDGDEKPDLASLTLGSLNFPRQASINDPDTIRALADRMLERGIVPELEIFDFGMVDYAKYLIDRGVLRPPFYFNLLLGSLGTLSATPLHLATLVESLPDEAVWAAAGIGRFQFAMNSLAVTMGGHVRVGLEDNLWLDPEKTRPATNQLLVERIARLARAAEREPASPVAARLLLGLPTRARQLV